MHYSSFPATRLRRLRYEPLVRRLVRETVLSPDRFILPLFVRSGVGIRQAIPSMPNHFQLSIDELVLEAEQAVSLGLGGIILFGIPETKDSIGSDAMSEVGIIARAVRAVKQTVGNKLLVITDLCFCEYTDHGHCGVVYEKPNGGFEVDNDATLENLFRQALVHARSGADILAPSGMMDGMVRALRSGLDREGFSQIPIMSYAAKYASAFYGPFREAAESSPQMGDRRSYQMDSAAAAGQAVREVQLDLDEGADIVIVKPALAYLDIVRLVRDRFEGVPIAAYNVSGEYCMVQAAAEKGWIDEKAIVLESMTAITRAGASIIITYWAKKLAQWL
ncbi:MAG: porphobilinogen synthase [Planctomycetaceae bacterium]|jgi:porphobilinogen synthase|nr:porphobilinogen synthase [Planctomycetaceae bacterium]